MNASSEPNPTGPAAAAQFCTTHWSMVLTAGQRELPQATEALEKLCRAYWYPLYFFARRQGSSPEDAQDLTQDFFSHHPPLAAPVPLGVVS